jgi:hypothetical protein
MRASADAYTELFTYMSIGTCDRETINHYSLRETRLRGSRSNVFHGKL